MIESNAIFSDDRLYRYVLWRTWDISLPSLMMIGLNPSKANELDNDPTIRRCLGFAKLWGFGSLHMTNLFAYMATLPNDLKNADDPIGEENNHWLVETSKRVEKIVFAWGVHGKFNNRDEEVINLFQNAFCIGVTKEGFPKHPLYLRKDLHPVIFKRNEMIDKIY